MTQDLPLGLITPTGTIGSEMDSLDAVAVEDVARLWRVYSTHSSVQQNGDPSRLENLFWRIWGSSELQKTLTGSILSMLFMEISEDRPLRTTPRQSPSAAAKKTSRVISGAVDISTSLENVPSAAHSVGTRTPLPSILKKPNAGRSSANPGEPSSLKMTRILIPESASEKIKATLTPTRVSSATEKPGRKKATFAANSSKRRPVVMRHKSSQTSSSTEEVLEDSLLAAESTKKKSGSSVQDAVIQEEWNNLARGLSWESLSYLRSDAASNQKGTPPSPPVSSSRSSPPPVRFSVSSVHHHRSLEHKSSLTDQEELILQPSTSLVDQDFRTQFVERRHQGAASGRYTTDDGTSSSLADPASSYLKSLIASSLDVSQLPRSDSRSLSPPAKSLMKTLPRKRMESDNTNPNADTTPPNNKQARQQPHRANYASLRDQQQEPSVQGTSASGVFSLPKFPQTNHHLTSMVERSRQKRSNRS